METQALIKVMVSRNIGLKVGEDIQGKGIFENVFLNLDSKVGTEVELRPEDIEFIKTTVECVLECQRMLAEAVKLPDDLRFDRDLKLKGI